MGSVLHCGGLPLPAQGVQFVGYTPGVGHGELKYSGGRGSVGTITVTIIHNMAGAVEECALAAVAMEMAGVVVQGVNGLVVQGG